MRANSLESKVLDLYGVELKEILMIWYWSEGLSQKDISKKLCVSTGSICNAFKRYNIPKREQSSWLKGFKHNEESLKKMKRAQSGRKVTEETKKKISESRKGFKLVGKYERFSGKKARNDGYVQVYKPEHPYCNSDGYVMEHRLVMESHLGRNLNPEEEIHHINHIRNDNRIENLHLFASKKDHMKFHMLERHGKQEELKYEYK